jgi:Tol biopolymer transport system component
VVRTENGRHRVEYPIGTVLYETQALRAPAFARVSPRDGEVAFFDFAEIGDYALTVVSAQHPRRVLSRGWRAIAGAEWSPDGKEFWFGGARPGGEIALWAVDLTGRERLLTQIPGSGLLCDVARDGKLLLSNTDTRIGLRALVPGAKEERDLAWLDASSLQDLSADGSQVLFVELSSGEGRSSALYLRRTDGSPAVRLGYGNRASISPDSNWIACVRRERGSSRLVLLPTGAGEEKLLSTGGIQPEAVEWFADGKRLMFTGSESNQAPRTYLLELESSRTRPVTPPGVRASAVSPDGQFATIIAGGKLSLHSLDSGRDVSVGPLNAGVSVIRWSGDGRHIFLQQNWPTRRSRTILRMDVRTGVTEVWRDLKLPDPTALIFGAVRMTADGQSYAFSFQRDLGTLYLVKGVK